MATEKFAIDDMHGQHEHEAQQVTGCEVAEPEAVLAFLEDESQVSTLKTSGKDQSQEQGLQKGSTSEV